jgi:hypothetical protein
VAGEQIELRYDSWAERLEREIAIILTPILDSSYSKDKCREVSGRLANLASKRAREASALDDDEPTVKCRGCKTSIMAAVSVCLCESCSRQFGVVRDE